MAGQKILVVDDDRGILKLIVAMLRRGDYVPLAANGGQEALELHRAEHPEIVLLDLLMPGMDGFALLERLPVSLPVLMVSGTGDSRDRVADNWRRGMAFLSKPFSSEEFLVALAYVMWEADR